jgi:hypothetical protein
MAPAWLDLQLRSFVTVQHLPEPEDCATTRSTRTACVLDAALQACKQLAMRGERAPSKWSRRALCIGCATVAMSCSFLHEQVAISSAHECIEKQCQAEQGKARQECATLCQRKYGP